MCWIIKHSFKLLCMSLLPARTRKFPPKMKVLEWSQKISIVSIRRFFMTLKCSNAYSIIGDGILEKFKFIQAFKVDLHSCNNDDPFQNENTKLITTFFPIISLWGFPAAQWQFTL